MMRIPIFQWQVNLIQKANSGFYSDKQPWFFPFKDNLLKQYGEFNGYDKQILQKKCYRCHGDGFYTSRCDTCRYEGDCSNCHFNEDDYDEREFKNANKCPKCNGTGFYANRSFWLERWKIGGSVFHIPVVDESKLPFLMEPPQNVFTEKLKHQEVSSGSAIRAAGLLFLMFDMKHWLRWQKVGNDSLGIKWKIQGWRERWGYYGRLWDRVRFMFRKGKDEDGDGPF